MRLAPYEICIDSIPAARMRKTPNGVCDHVCRRATVSARIRQPRYRVQRSGDVEPRVCSYSARHDWLPLTPSAEQIMGMPAETRRRWSAADVRRELLSESRHWPRYELVDGELIVTPAPSMAHQEALEWLSDRLKPYVQRERLGRVLRSPADIELEPGTIVQPDIFIVPRDVAEHAREWPDVTRLALAAEVLSPGSAWHDRGPKRVLYQRAGVDEYWVVDLDSRVVERWRPHEERPEIARDQLVWQPAEAAAPLVLALCDLFV